jgi:hypothetical protein
MHSRRLASGGAAPHACAMPPKDSPARRLAAPPPMATIQHSGGASATWELCHGSSHRDGGALTIRFVALL